MGWLPTSRPDKNLLFHIPAPALAPGNPTVPASEGRKRRLGCCALCSASPMVPGCWGWCGGGKERGERTQQASQHQTRPPSRTGPPAATSLASALPGNPPFTAHFYGAFCSLEGNVPCAHKYARMIYARGRGLPGPSTLLTCGQIRGAVGEFFPFSTWHSVNVAIMLFMELGKKNAFLSLGEKSSKHRKKFLKNPPWY